MGSEARSNWVKKKSQFWLIWLHDLKQISFSLSMHFLICTELKTQISQDGDEVINAKLLPRYLHITCAQWKVSSLMSVFTGRAISCGCILSAPFVWLLGGRQEGQTDCVEGDSLLRLGFCFGSLLILSEFMSLLEGERATENECRVRKRWKGVMGWWELWSVLCLHPSHLYINAIQMICCKKLCLHRCDGWK